MFTSYSRCRPPDDAPRREGRTSGGIAVTLDREGCRAPRRCMGRGPSPPSVPPVRLVDRGPCRPAREEEPESRHSHRPRLGRTRPRRRRCRPDPPRLPTRPPGLATRISWRAPGGPARSRRRRLVGDGPRPSGPFVRGPGAPDERDGRESENRRPDRRDSAPGAHATLVVPPDGLNTLEISRTRAPRRPRAPSSS